MASLSPADAALLAPLNRLSLLQQGVPQYYIALAESPDEVLRVAAWRSLIDLHSVPERLHPNLLADCKFAGVQKRAFDHFESIFEHSLAEQTAKIEPVGLDSARRLSRALLDHDEALAAEANILQFLQTGMAPFLTSAGEHAERADGWRGGIRLLARAFGALPQHPIFIGSLLRLLHDSDQYQLALRLADFLEGAPMFGYLSGMVRAVAAAVQREDQLALSLLAKLEGTPALAQPLAPYRGIIRKIRADALHRMGDTRRAYSTYLEVHAIDRAGPKNYDPAEYRRALEVRAKLDIPQLPPDPRTDVVQMLGFPRSGTTLLENALGAHKLIETFEEVPTLRAANIHIERIIQQKRPWSGTPADMYQLGRTKYYEEIDRLRRKPQASVLVDKLPIRTAEAKYLAKLFPDWRYIFSIRHPYDVILSCFRQRFAPNVAMENFRSISDASQFYDFVMEQWFSVHTLDDPKVHYVRYDELATDFQPTVERVLGFLGLDWDDAVLDFAAKAEHRAARTPSYQKVRRGLSVGVQTYWRNYGFLFQSADARPLHKWAEFFGYPTK